MTVGTPVKGETEVLLDQWKDAGAAETRKWMEYQDKLTNVPSHMLVETDDQGEPYIDRFVYVDEYTCIGCTHCSHAAPNTFFMEEDHGRARVFQQGTDGEDTVR
ncbi:unnamed protein product, partial [Discosporangium mesarthrocarpum]